MDKQQHPAKNRRILRRYTDQPDAMPREIRQRMEEAMGDDPVQLYGLADLDARLQLARTWVALGPRHLVIHEDGNGRAPKVIERAGVKHVRQTPGLSCTTVHLLGDPDEPALGVFRYSYRQQAAMGALLFVLENPHTDEHLDAEAADDYYAQAIAEPIQQAQASVAQSKASVVVRLCSYLKPYRGRFALGVLGAAIFTAITLIPPMLTQKIIDEGVVPFSKGLITRDEAMSFGWKIVLVLVAVYLFRELFLWVRLRTLTIVGELVARDLRQQLYDHLHKLSISYFSRTQTGSIISRVSSDTDRIWDFIAFGVAEMLLSVLMVIGLSVVLLLLDWQLGLVLILPVPLIFYFIYRMGRTLHRVFLRIWRKWSEMTAVLSDTVPGIRVVQAFNQSDHERGRFNEKNDRVLDEAVLIHRIWTNKWPLIFLGLNIMTLLVWVFALPRMTSSPELATHLTTGEFVAFLFYMGMFVMPLEQFGFLTRMINRSISSAHRVFEILDTEPEIVNREKTIRLEPMRGRITFEKVTFGYDRVRQIIKGISFEVKPGEMIGLVGPSGAGKTTVINLIARFYDANTGRILIDGHDVRDLELGNHRNQIGMVMQDPYLFHGSILENIRYGRRDATLEQVIAAAKAANAHEFILKLPAAYDTIVGERGHTLSGGERQRVSIARAILHDPRILILDEATSSVDTETERKIQEAIERLVTGRTVIAIAHRLSTLSRADRLLVMKDGKLVEEGKHRDLLENEDGVYTRLHKMQVELHSSYGA